MADSDFDDDLLALAEGTSKRKSKSSSSKPNKRRRPAESESDGSASDMDMSQSDSDDAPAPSPKASRGRKVKSAAQVDSSDEDDDGEEVEAPTDDNPYPIKGLSEIDREGIIGDRKDEMAERKLRKQAAQMAATSGRNGAAAGSDDEEEEEYGSRSTRSRKVVGSTSTKAAGIEKLKQSRAEKGKKKEKKVDSDDEDYEELSSRVKSKSKGKGKRRGSDSDSDGDSSDDDRGKKGKGKGKKTAQPAGPEELGLIVLPRAKLAEMCPAPWFEKWVIGAWVRYSVGVDQQGQPAYRLCEVIEVKHDKPYRFENVSTDIHLKLKHGKAERLFSMDAVSNSPFSQREYARLNQTCAADKVDMPSSKDVAHVRDQLAKHTSYILTEEDLAKQLAEKKKKMTGAQLKARLHMERSQAHAANDQEKLADINAQLAELDKSSGEPRETAAKLNERNRLSNREEVRRAEARGQGERRKLQEALAKGENVAVDASARVKTMPKMSYDSRPQTPSGTPARNTPAPSGVGAPVVPKAAAKTAGGKIEASVASRVQLNLDLDF
ncbi:RNA polymerase-associated protein rtf1 [Rhodosporidiobolus nylandii]